jgi:hypothetical protein
MKIVILPIVLVLSFGMFSDQAQTTNDPTITRSNDAIVEKLKRAMQELLDAVAPGDVGVWQKYLAEGCLYTDEEGNVRTREDLLKELKPLPKGYLGTIKMGEPKIFVQENVIVLSHRDREELEYTARNL